MTVGTSAVPRCDHRVDQVRSRGRCRARCSRCRPRSGRAAPPSPKQCAVTLAPCVVRDRDRLGERLRRERRRQVARLAADPVADQLDPAVAALRLLGDVRREVVGLDLVGVVADVALGAGDVPARPDQPRQVVAVVDPGGVGRRARSRGSAARRRPGRSTACCSVVSSVDAAVVVEPEVAVRVDQARHDPAARDRLRRATASPGDPAVDDVQVADLAVGQDRSARSSAQSRFGRYRC